MPFGIDFFFEKSIAALDIIYLYLIVQALYKIGCATNFFL